MVETSQSELVKRVALNQALWSFGQVLTGGSFLVFFIHDLYANFTQISLALAIPELVGVFALFTRVLLQAHFQSKQIWSRLLITARIVAMGIPICCFFNDELRSSTELVHFLLLFLAISEFLQAFSYTAYLSWIAELSGRDKWGKLFAYRNIAKVCVLLVWATAVGLTRDYTKNNLSPETLENLYISLFLAGCLAQICSWIPLRNFPTGEFSPRLFRHNWSTALRQLFRQSSFCWLLFHNWTLAFFNGLTQSVFFLYSVRELHLGLTASFGLLAVMRLAKIPVSLYAGKACDQNRDKQMLWGGLVIASSGLFFWLLATEEQPWWLIPAYFLWGFYAAANIGGQNLLLKHAPDSDNTLHLALFQKIGGFLAGLSGLLGGLLLSTAGTSNPAIHIHDTYLSIGDWGVYTNIYHLIILISLCGRYFSLLFLIPVNPYPQEVSSED